MTELRSLRKAFRISQSKLARLSGVSRFKICLFELGDGQLSLDDQVHIRETLQAEAERLRTIPVEINFSQIQSSARGGGRD
jgi:predicted transcriptional regulator